MKSLHGRRGVLAVIPIVALILAACGPSGAGDLPPLAPTAPAAQATVATGTTAEPTVAPSPAVEASATAVLSPTEAPTAASSTAGQATESPLSQAATEMPVTVAPTAAPASTTPPTATSAPTTAPTEVAQAPLDCTPGALTPAQTEGPYYSENPPERSSLLEPGMTGTKLTITGYVLDAECRPLPRARVDFWQADAEGQYDNEGYTLRGYQLTDEQGRYRLETVVPGLYTGRTSHIHVKVTPAGGATLTTQLYMPDVAQNQQDGIFDEQTVLRDVVEGPDGIEATFNFVVNSR